MPRRAGPGLAVLAVVALSLLVAGCARGAGSAGGTTTTTRPRNDDDERSRPAPGPSAIDVAADADLSVVTCTAPRVMHHGLDDRADVSAVPRQGQPSRRPGALPVASGDGISCRAEPAASAPPPQPEPGGIPLRIDLGGPPATISAAQGITAIDCTGPTFCVTIDGEGNSFAYDGNGWSGNIGAWGAANQISCVLPVVLRRRRRRPFVFNGSTWTQPGDIDTQGQLNSVSCASTTFCVIVDSNGAVLTWNGSSFTPPATIATEPPLTGTNTSGLTCMSCPDHDVLPRRRLHRAGLRLNGTTWSAGTLIDNGHALTSISCPTVSYCVAVDRVRATRSSPPACTRGRLRRLAAADDPGQQLGGSAPFRQTGQLRAAARPPTRRAAAGPAPRPRSPWCTTTSRQRDSTASLEFSTTPSTSATGRPTAARREVRP